MEGSGSIEADVPTGQGRLARVGRIAGWTLGAVLLLAVLLALFAWLALPSILRDKAQQALGAELGRTVAIGRIEIDPLSPALRVHEVSIADRDPARTLLAFERLEVDGSWRTILRRAPVIAGVRLIAPSVALSRERDGKLNVQDLIDKWAGKPPSDGPTPAFSVANIRLVDGRAVFDDRLASTRHEITGLGIDLPFVSSLPVDVDVSVHPRLAATVNGAPFHVEGESHPFHPDRETTLSIDLDAVDLTRYLHYLPPSVPVAVRAGRLSTRLRLAFAQPPKANARLDLRGTATLAQAELRERGGEPLLSVAELALEGLALTPLEGRYTIGKAVLRDPALTVRRRAGQATFFESLQPARAAGAEAPREGAPARAGGTPIHWQVDEVVVQGAKVDVADEAFTPRPLALRIDPLQATIKGLSGAPEAAATYELSLATAQGEALSADGRFVLAPLAVEGGFKLERVALKPWWWIVEPTLAVDADSGELALAGRYALSQPQGRTRVLLSELGAQLRNLVLRQRWDRVELLRLATLDVGGVGVDLDGRAVTVGSVSASQGRVLVRRDAQGRLNLARLAVSAAPEAPGAAGAAGAQAGARRVDAPPEWSVALDNLLLERFDAAIEDQAAGKAADIRVQGIRLAAERLGNARDARGSIDLAALVNTRGQLRVRGPLGLNPLAGTLAIDARELGIVPLQPYFTDYVNALVSSGFVSARGELAFAVPSGGAPSGRFAGDASLTEFAAVTREGNDDLLRWKALKLSGLDIVPDPLKVAIGEIALEDFYTRLVIDPAGRFNLQDVIRKRAPATAPEGAQAGAGGAAAPATAASEAPGSPPPAGTGPTGAVVEPIGEGPAQAPRDAAPPPQRPLADPRPPSDIRIGRITLSNGNIDFTDNFIKPNYSANLTGMGGTVGAMSPGTPGDVALAGRIDDTGSVDIRGSIDPLARALYLDIEAKARDIDLPRISPYSVKYIGYGIEKGKLSATVKYKVVDRQLSAENNIVLDQLTFGEKVDSPSAIKAPVLFAVSLLKDRNGVIDVNLPISGSLDDPQFSVAGIVLRIIGNLIVKAVTAPFSLLASLAGGAGQELSYVAFPPGRALLVPDEQKKLETLAKALGDRPGLKLEIAGRIDPAGDREALRRLTVERAIKAIKLKETVRGGETAGAIDAVTLSPEEYPKYLLEAYKAASFERPRTRLGALAEQPSAEMERMLREHVVVGDGDLEALAHRRAVAIEQWLATQGKVAGERMFVVSTRAEDSPKGAPPSRADLALK
jgi:hypothetical protein